MNSMTVYHVSHSIFFCIQIKRTYCRYDPHKVYAGKLYTSHQNHPDPRQSPRFHQYALTQGAGKSFKAFFNKTNMEPHLAPLALRPSHGGTINTTKKPLKSLSSGLVCANLRRETRSRRNWWLMSTLLSESRNKWWWGTKHRLRTKCWSATKCRPTSCKLTFFPLIPILSTISLIPISLFLFFLSSLWARTFWN